MNVQRERIHQLADKLISTPPSKFPKYDFESMRSLFSRAIREAGIRVPKHEYSTRTPFGRALPPESAARCLLDAERTQAFVKGLYRAVIEAKRRFPGERIRILYAGCGPFASLATIASSLFEDGELEITALDIHELSVKCAQKVAECLGLQENIPNIVTADAVDYSHTGKLFHIIIVETMSRMLLQEPQAAVTTGTARYLHPNGIFIPESVLVRAWLRNQDGSDETLLGDIVDLRKNFGRAAVTGKKVNHAHLGRLIKVDCTFQIPELSTIKDLVCGTEIQIFGENSMRRGAGKLNRDTGMAILPAWTPGNVRIRYAMGKDTCAAVQINHYINGTVHEDFLF